MKDYSAMHDAEINMLVCKRLGLGISSYCRILSIGDYSILLDDNNTLVDYCNNPSDAWPVIVANNISLHAPRFKEWWMAEFTGGDEDVNDGFDVDYFESKDANPLRAAMTVYLMMKDAEKCHG